jgi:ribosomal protein S18 acetylase RimI-like enzyme
MPSEAFPPTPVGCQRISYSGGYLDWRQGSGHTIEIYDIYVTNDVRKRGHGRRMIDLLLDRFMPRDTTMVWAITRVSNQIAQVFYEQMRFRVVALLRDFYRDEPLDSGKPYADAVMYGRRIGSQE